MKKWVTGLTSVLFLLLLLSQGASQEKLDNPSELYDSSMALYYKGNGETAIRGFSKIIQSAPASKLVPYSQYMIGLCYLKMEKYQEAIEGLALPDTILAVPHPRRLFCQGHLGQMADRLLTESDGRRGQRIPLGPAGHKYRTELEHGGIHLYFADLPRQRDVLLPFDGTDFCGHDIR